MEDLFFTTEHGLTSSEANHVANVIKEIVEGHLRRLSLLTTITQVAKIDGADIQISKANFYPALFQQLAETAPRLYRLSAWLREAVKAKELSLMATETAQCPSWKLTEFDREKPLHPIEQREVEHKWGVRQLDIKARAQYLALEAEAAAYGKLIHADGHLAKLRHEQTLTGLQWITGPDGKSHPASTEVNSKQQEMVETLFFATQQKHREVSKRLNAIKHQINELIARENTTRRHANELAYQAYQSELATWNTGCEAVDAKNSAVRQAWQKEQVAERARIAALKIIIPHDLQETLDMVRAYTGD